MGDFVARRARWYSTLQGLDKSISISEELRTDLLIQTAKLTAVEELMLQTTTQHKLEWDVVSKALQEQHPRSLNAPSSRETHHEQKQHSKGGRWRKGYYVHEEQATAPATAYVAADVTQVDPPDDWDDAEWQEEGTLLG